ncbi:sugar transferase [Dyadobacter sp. CY312]|uniref:sugar transferase n=1 Tax=Dyadobacter sp. CY312 TaxID=2907303 RepID=UPI001F1A5515|nr:sugar transferase [Dyadobacter sp. CY312]MCE7042925.1 sugar transferase [Dyadobacter sp. CY312]
MYKRWGKRSLDIILAGTGLIILFPLFILITLLLFISGQRNPFFFQSRPGLNGVAFTIIKFKSMIDEKDNSQLSENERITKIGKVLRGSSLDEIPQLWNVITGDMSLVGPRPLLTEYLPLYNSTQNQRHNVKPGITGWAQINGRNALDWQQRLDMDVWYTQNVSFALDFKILVKTVSKLLRATNGPTQETDIPEKFKA